MNSKTRFAMDDSNRLVVKRNHKVLFADGRLSTDRNSRLVYWLNQPVSWRREHRLPAKFIFEGRWNLSQNNDLVFVLNRTKSQYKGDRLVLKGEIIGSDQDCLSFEITSYDSDGKSHTQLLRLSGFWNTDRFNRISFAVKKKNAPDIITLEGAWELNQNQQIVYRYEKTALKKKTKYVRILLFEGFWQFNQTNRLTYILEKSQKSYLNFRVQLESPNLYPQKGVIKYRLGIGLNQERKPEQKCICLYGAWKYDRMIGFIYEMDYGSNGIHRIEFGIDCCIIKKNQVTISLVNKRRESLGLTVTFSHSFLKQADAEIFLRLKKFQQESGIEAGARITF